MAAAKSNAEIYIPDGSFDWSGGVDSSLVTTLQSALNVNGLPRNALAWLNNATVRGGGISQRAGWQPLARVMASGFRHQGQYIYEPDGANPYLVVSLSGVLHSVLLEAPYTITDLTGGNPLLRNPPNVEMAFFCQGENYLVVQAGDYYTPGPVVPGVTDSLGRTLPLFWNGLTLRRSIGITTSTPSGIKPGINEIPAGTSMDYYGNHLWWATARACSAGDTAGSGSGTAAFHFRDAILNVTENPLCFGGDGFAVPTNAGNIRALKHSSSLNASLGQGQFYIFTRKVIYTLDVPTTRTDWINADASNQPKMTVVQIVNGAVGDRAVVPINGDLFYQSFDPAIRSLLTAVRNFGQWGNTPISQNVLRALALNNRGLMRFSGGIQFNNRLLMLVLPVQASDGVNVVHQAILPLDFDVVTNLVTASPTDVSGTSAMVPPVWEGAYDGLAFLQLSEGDFGGLPRAFATAIDEDGSLNVWELTNNDRFQDGDNRLVWSPEWPAFTWGTAGLEFKLKQLKGGECWVDQVFGDVDMAVYYRPDADPCWRPWFVRSFCSKRDCRELDDPCVTAYPPPPFNEGYVWPIVFPEPPQSCNSMAVRPSSVGYQFQVKIMLKGPCRIRGMILYAIPHTEPQYHGLAEPHSITGGMARLPLVPTLLT
jgi:hypothetical protein